jgi:hypothetical protein
MPVRSISLIAIEERYYRVVFAAPLRDKIHPVPGMPKITGGLKYQQHQRK